MTYQAKLIAGGKIVIPAELRKALGFQTGDSLVLEREGDSIVIKTYAQVVREVQKEFRTMVGEGYSVDQFLAERRADWGEE
ncbi:AbrB/MazE/SpoVT family DNA-binding domain-containing protein [Sphingomonas sp. QA11]|uniref:AbrB/MazE/SpoVT family DNA-binding domain-containing protein n=1 Tax=Sphingomonas sp. QA11 TaxID=2950605 RepID=UPI0023494684|nr:AbrB/MazE/SpoVT family DNA-binding domain-containing protein [Sphingomonas sp. QA11]WCM26055.1 AbrB/MazE/SpoVT family DNA-binding domain-containing protein [Sphingomonas sp. QA11]